MPFLNNALENAGIKEFQRLDSKSTEPQFIAAYKRLLKTVESSMASSTLYVNLTDKEGVNISVENLKVIGDLFGVQAATAFRHLMVLESSAHPPTPQLTPPLPGFESLANAIKPDPTRNHQGFKPYSKENRSQFYDDKDTKHKVVRDALRGHVHHAIESLGLSANELDSFRMVATVAMQQVYNPLKNPSKLEVDIALLQYAYNKKYGKNDGFNPIAVDGKPFTQTMGAITQIYKDQKQNQEKNVEHHVENPGPPTPTTSKVPVEKSVAESVDKAVAALITAGRLDNQARNKSLLVSHTNNNIRTLFWISTDGEVFFKPIAADYIVTKDQRGGDGYIKASDGEKYNIFLGPGNIFHKKKAV